MWSLETDTSFRAPPKWPVHQAPVYLNRKQTLLPSSPRRLTHRAEPTALPATMIGSRSGLKIRLAGKHSFCDPSSLLLDADYESLSRLVAVSQLESKMS